MNPERVCRCRPPGSIAHLKITRRAVRKNVLSSVIIIRLLNI